MDFAAIAKRLHVDPPDKFRIADADPGDDFGLSIDKAEGKDLLDGALKRLHQLQEVLYAEGRWSVLVVLQGMDTAGKDGIIEHVIGGINPQGCEVHSFKQPSAEELEHDFLWRATRRLPPRGRIGVFNRSYYEDVVVVRVHPEFLDKQKLPASLITKNLWQERFDDIRGFERHLARNGTLVMKFFLNVSRDEQRKRLLDRLEDKNKRWKFALGDMAERALWPKYMEAYEDAIRSTSTAEAPWYVVPADRKWLGRLMVAAILVDALERLKPAFPKVEDAVLQNLEQARKTLQAGQ